MQSRAETISIDFGKAFIKIALFRPSGQQWMLLDYAFKRIAFSGGNEQEIKDFIGNFMEKNSVARARAYLTIFDPERVILKYLSLPALPPAEMREAIKWQLKKEEPALPVENIVLDWQLIRESVGQEGVKKSEIMCAFADSGFIRTFLNLTKDCNLIPARVSSPPFNYAGILNVSLGEAAVSAVLDIGFHESFLCFYRDKRLSFIRRLSFSSDKLTQALTSVSAADTPGSDLAYEKAEEIKKTIEIPSGAQAAPHGDCLHMRSMSLIRPFLEGLTKELSRSLHYYASTFNTHGPSSLYLTGGGANFKNLTRYLTQELSLPVAILPLPSFFTAHGLQGKDLCNDQNQIANVAGAVLAGADAVNLLPAEYVTEKIEQVESASLRVAAFAVSSILLLSLFFVQFQIRDYKKRLAQASAYLEGIKDIELLKRRIDERKEAINRLQKGHIPVDGILKLISATIPNDTRLDDLMLDQAGHVVVLRGEVSVNGDAAERTISNFIRKLQGSRFVAEARLTFLDREKEFQRFEIKCDLVR
ncbi:MAG: pilus assembly protein PilM [Candidatus Omnitrophica bacterium]|nr:pilus assembly protein PilM [Candidatus Omnitrophota bacterium]